MILSLILAVSTFSFFSYGAQSFTFALYVNGESNAQIGIDGEAVVTMVIEGSEAYTFYSMQDYIKFDTNYFELDEDSISVKQIVSLGQYTDLFSHTPISTNGVYDRVFVNRASLSGVEFSADETIVTFTLKPLKQGTTQITHYRVEMLDGSNSHYSVNEENATVVIGSASGSETTEASTEEATETATEAATVTEATTTTAAEATETTTASSSSLGSSGGSGGGSSSSTYTITLVVNGEKTTVTVKSGSVLTQPDDPTAEGYVFEGWYTDMAYVTEYDFTQAVTGSFTLYAKMVKIEDDSTDTSTDTQTDTDSSGLYSDVASDDWFDEAVRYVTERGIMIGISEDEFAPNMPLTRGMFVTVLHRIEGTPEESEEPTFGDVSDDAWYYEAVKWGQKHNIIYGYSDEEYGPNDRITREQMAAIIYRYAAYKGINTDVEGEASYTDSQSITNYAKPAVKWVSDKGFMQGDPDGSFRPLDNASRAETAQVIMNVIENLARYK